ncbi:MAG: ribonuclease P protein subunit [Candidatus Diapherotrites archaeon]|uniref:Ribonuclease P protein component 1 n=1 Tax=Candidatus Iainarchaeum sp. TaxID=3101447 RepID=A0A8T4LFP0_9ARCH|nr:ribonuclease P protein subunit [Candidatus Diapherotrites archaeon]
MIIEITEKNLAGHEWIGLDAVVIASTDPGRVGKKGRIVGETKNTVVLESDSREIVLPKKEVKLEIEWKEKKYTLDLKEWCFRPEDRIKALVKKKK